MANLYELQGQMLQIEYALEENGGELTDELAELLTDTEISIKQKADGYRVRQLFFYSRFCDLSVLKPWG
jgi:hypothetical protein